MCWDTIVGVDYSEGPPVPIPNTEVKLTGADNTWLETAREDKLTPTQRQRQAKSLPLFFCVLGSKKGREQGQQQCVLDSGFLETGAGWRAHRCGEKVKYPGGAGNTEEETRPGRAGAGLY